MFACVESPNWLWPWHGLIFDNYKLERLNKMSFYEIEKQGFENKVKAGKKCRLDVFWHQFRRCWYFDSMSWRRKLPLQFGEELSRAAFSLCKVEKRRRARPNFSPFSATRPLLDHVTMDVNDILQYYMTMYNVQSLINENLRRQINQRSNIWPIPFIPLGCCKRIFDQLISHSRWLIGFLRRRFVGHFVIVGSEWDIQCEENPQKQCV